MKIRGNESLRVEKSTESPNVLIPGDEARELKFIDMAGNKRRRLM